MALEAVPHCGELAVPHSEVEHRVRHESVRVSARQQLNKEMTNQHLHVELLRRLLYRSATAAVDFARLLKVQVRGQFDAKRLEHGPVVDAELQNREVQHAVRITGA